MKKFFIIFMLVLMMFPVVRIMAETVDATPAPEVIIVTETPVFFSLTGIILTFFGLLSLVLTRYAVPWFRSNTSINQRTLLQLVVTTLVFAAEQLYKGSGKGAEKMAYVKAELRKRGFDIDIAEIEAAVRELNIMQDDLFDEEVIEPIVTV